MARYGPCRHGKRRSRNAPCQPPPRRELSPAIANRRIRAGGRTPTPHTIADGTGAAGCCTRRLSVSALRVAMAYAAHAQQQSFLVKVAFRNIEINGGGALGCRPKAVDKWGFSWTRRLLGAISSLISSSFGVVIAVPHINGA